MASQVQATDWIQGPGMGLQPPRPHEKESQLFEL